MLAGLPDNTRLIQHDLSLNKAVLQVEMNLKAEISALKRELESGLNEIKTELWLKKSGKPLHLATRHSANQQHQHGNCRIIFPTRNPLEP